MYLLYTGGGRGVPGMPAIDFSGISIPGSSTQQQQRGPGTQAVPQQGGMSDDPATLREMLLASPHDLALLKERNPPLAEALLSGSLGEVSHNIYNKSETMQSGCVDANH